MPEHITGEVAGGCPKCKNPDVEVPDDFSEETIIECKCGYKAPHREFFAQD
jgi:hypothetical protein